MNWEKSELYAHTVDDGRLQMLEEHLYAVAKSARDMALPQFSDMAFAAGLYHDVGKASKEFQNYLLNDGLRVEHAVCGAQYVRRKSSCMSIPYVASAALEYIISGHHAGLPNFGAAADGDDMGTLCARLKRHCVNTDVYADSLDAGSINYGRYVEFISSGIDPHGVNAVAELRKRFIFSVRYLFSLLTDADCMDAEAFCVGTRTPPQVDFSHVESSLAARLGGFATNTLVRRIRTKLRNMAMKNVDKTSRIFALDMPTGSGKTLTGLSVALKLLRERDLKRIIYVIPYTSILDQTAKEFSVFFGNDRMLVHHSNFDFDELAGEAGADAAACVRKSTENWDASIVLTTNVRFFESVYGATGGKLRRLHNIAQSVIVFDEIHTLPTELFEPCMEAVRQLTDNYGSTVLFMTATMPDFSELLARYFGDNLTVKPLISDKSDFSAFDNCEFTYLGMRDDTGIAEQAAVHASSLIIVNSRKHALALYKQLGGNKVHLSTAMTPADRATALGRIKTTLDRIKNENIGGEHITVVSTSLVEAGVDLDFEAVFRELGGLDNILQAAGRCNREGERAHGVTYIFESNGKVGGELAAKQAITKRLIDEFGTDKLKSVECIREYYAQVYEYAKELMNIRKVDADEYVYGNHPEQYKFAAYANDFRFIDDTSYGVIIPCAEIEDELAQLRNTGYANKRKLRRYTASVTKSVYTELGECGALEYVGDFTVLAIPDYYSSETGLSADAFEIKII